MGIFKSKKKNNDENQDIISKYLDEIKDEVEQEMIECKALIVENGKKKYVRGSCHVRWAIEKRILKTRYNIDWKTPAEENPGIMFD